MDKSMITAIDPINLMVEAWVTKHTRPGVEPRADKVLVIDYTNWKGSRRWRPIIPVALYWGTNHHYHPEPQWLLEAEDLENLHEGFTKFFALINIHGVRYYKLPNT